MALSSGSAARAAASEESVCLLPAGNLIQLTQTLSEFAPPRGLTPLTAILRWASKERRIVQPVTHSIRQEKTEVPLYITTMFNVGAHSYGTCVGRLKSSGGCPSRSGSSCQAPCSYLLHMGGTLLLRQALQHLHIQGPAGDLMTGIPYISSCRHHLRGFCFS